MRAIIARLPDKAVFEPETVVAMVHALDQVCAALAIMQPEDRETIAMRIIDLARSGVRNANTLRDRVLAEAKSVA
jgi:hypothetical protein